MGVDLWSHDDNTLQTRATCGFVIFWCDRFCPVDYSKMTPGELHDTMGSLDYSAEAIKLVDEGVPKEFEAAKAAGFVDENHLKLSFVEESFEAAREFVARAAAAGKGADGSY